MLHVCVIKELLPVFIVYCHIANHTESNRTSAISSCPLFLNQMVSGPRFFRRYSQMIGLELSSGFFTRGWCLGQNDWRLASTPFLWPPAQVGWASSQHGSLRI